MAAPTVNTITPAEGLSLGGTFVTIDGFGFNDEASGGTVRVLFGTEESPEHGVVDATKVLARTPGGAVGAVDVTVENVPAAGPAEPTVVVDGFEYKRPAIETKPDHSTDGGILIVTRALVSELRRTVLENTHHDVHPEYTDAVSAALEEELQSSAPVLKIMGPLVAEDPFYAIRGKYNLRVTPAPGQFDAYSQPVTVQLLYDYEGYGRTGGEAKNLYEALARYLNATPSITVPIDGDDPANGTLSFELQPIWENRAEFRGEATRQASYQFTGQFAVRGVHLVSGKAWEGRDLTDEVEIEAEQIPP